MTVQSTTISVNIEEETIEYTLSISSSIEGVPFELRKV